MNEQRIKDLIALMTLEEKVSQLSYTSPAIPRLEIPAYNWWNEALHGVARAGMATVFPQAIGLAATFDETLVEQVAQAISDEARAKYHEAVRHGNRGQYWGLTFWTPNVNIFRDPRWGRGQETYGEDPFLTSVMGTAFVYGLQGRDSEHLKVAACAKHFAVHSGPEPLRHCFDAQVSQKDLHETYLPAFKALVEAGVEAVMGAYNRTLGEPCCGSELLLKKILRDTWHFNGHVTSDCWALVDFHEHHKVTKTPEESAALALNAGCDLNCGCTYPYLTVAYKKGLVTEAAIDTALERLLRTRFKLGMFDPPEADPYSAISSDVINCEKHRQLALTTAHKSIVLLKNDNNLLPLDDSPKNILVVGPEAANIHSLLGNYFGLSPHLSTILEGITGRMQGHFGIQVEYRQGCLQYKTDHPANVQLGSDPHDVIIAVFGLDGTIEGEEGDAIASDSNGDRDSIELPPWQLEYLQHLKASTKKLILVLTGGSPIAFPPDIADSILFVWYPGEAGGTAVADVLFGDVNPSGKLPLSFPASTAQLPPFEDYALKGRTYRYMTEQPLYPFGFGLSYSSFKFESLTVDRTGLEQGDSLTATVTLTNTGAREAEEVVQLYVSKTQRTEDDPITSLRAFKRVTVASGATAVVVFNISSQAFETVDKDGKNVLVPGSYTLIAANAAPVPIALERGAAAPVYASITIK
ncbi:Beta-glucosidase [Pillotina sp. SPG140]|jgi:beta-glucosidase